MYIRIRIILMKRQLFISFFVLASFAVVAQSFVPDADSVAQEDYANIIEIVAENDLSTDPLSDTVTLRWKRVVEQVPAGWESLVCDNNLCYGPTVDEAPQDAIVTGDRGNNIDVHFRPDSIEGEGLVEILIWDINDSLNSNYTLVFTAKAEGYDPALSANNIDITEEIKVYPNPAREFLYLRDLPVNNAVNVEIYNILGRKMLSESFTSSNASNEQRIDINELQKGIYLVRVFDAQMNILATHSISKVK